VDESQDKRIALSKLESMGVRIDTLTDEQRTYIEGFGEGT